MSQDVDPRLMTQLVFLAARNTFFSFPFLGKTLTHMILSIEEILGSEDVWGRYEEEFRRLAEARSPAEAPK